MSEQPRKKTMAEIDALKKDPAAYWHEHDHGGPPGETSDERRSRMYDVMPHDMIDDPPPPRPPIIIVPVESTRPTPEENEKLEINFKNELGNEVLLSMKNTCIKHEGLLVPCVMISMRSSSSGMMRIVISIKEAQEMRRMLEVFLKDVKN